MKYLGSEPFQIPVMDAEQPRPQIVAVGGPATQIPDAAKCPSGRHNRRLTECWCTTPVQLTVADCYVLRREDDAVRITNIQVP